MLSFQTRSRSFNGFPIETFFGEEYRKNGKQGCFGKKIPQKIGNNGIKTTEPDTFACHSFC